MPMTVSPRQNRPQTVTPAEQTLCSQVAVVETVPLAPKNQLMQPKGLSLPRNAGWLS